MYLSKAKCFTAYLSLRTEARNSNGSYFLEAKVSVEVGMPQARSVMEITANNDSGFVPSGISTTKYVPLCCCCFSALFFFKTESPVAWNVLKLSM